jgi:hypothetical protein
MASRASSTPRPRSTARSATQSVVGAVDERGEDLLVQGE